MKNFSFFSFVHIIIFVCRQKRKQARSKYPLCHMHLHLDRLFFFCGHFYTCVDFEENYIKAVLRNQVKINPPDVYGEFALRLQKRFAPKSTHFWVCNFLVFFSSIFVVVFSYFVLSFLSCLGCFLASFC